MTVCVLKKSERMGDNDLRSKNGECAEKNVKRL